MWIFISEKFAFVELAREGKEEERKKQESACLVLEKEFTALPTHLFLDGHPNTLKLWLVPHLPSYSSSYTVFAPRKYQYIYIYGNSR